MRNSVSLSILTIFLLVGFAAAKPEIKNNISHGPILSSVTNSSAAIWVRAEKSGKVKFVLNDLNIKAIDNK